MGLFVYGLPIVIPIGTEDSRIASRVGKDPPEGVAREIGCINAADVRSVAISKRFVGGGAPVSTLQQEERSFGFLAGREGMNPAT